MRVAILAAEAVPYSKTGGLGDVAGALPKALRRVGVDAVLITPLYLQTKGEYLSQVVMDDLSVDWRGQNFRARVFYSEANGSPTFLIDAPEYFHRSSIYGFREDYERFAFFNHAALRLIERVGAPPDIVHLNDWHCGFAAIEIAKLRRWDEYWQRTRTVFSIHNLAYQGAFGMDELWKLGFGDDFSRNAFSFDGSASALKAGLADSDMLSTVSRTYAREIQQPENGYGLDWLLRQRSDRLFGITNGVDYDVWNPETDKELPAHFNAWDLSAKMECKRQLLRKFLLPENLDKPIFANVSRLTAQKGFDLIQQVIGEVLATGAYFIALGSGAREHEDFLQKLKDFAPAQVGIYKGYNESLAHQIEAGADIFLMPSRFEPCGLNQMYSLRYGTVPIVRAVGGLEDTMQNFDRVNGTGNGFKFKEFQAGKFLEKIYEALFAYYEPETWRQIQRNGMMTDNSWENAARKYVELYQMTRS
ncbi:MAG: glycogen synthase [Acidobacteria bacterium]|nr:glycogen synthase [Acidobacteriota bacterium]MCA1639222.1 glycogen synthase [Acidobacteriota bacterium]